MKQKISLALCILIVIACNSDTSITTPLSKATYLLEAGELISMYQRPHIKILDLRDTEAFLSGHIPGAQNIGRSDIEDSSYSYRGMMPTKCQLESLFGKLGVSTKDTVVIYDDNGLCNATRLWWILQNFDFTEVKLLQGGIESWKTANGVITIDTSIVAQTQCILNPSPSMKYYVSKEDMKKALANKTVILDTRTDDEFSGKTQKKGASKAGRIPGSVHIDWAYAIHFDGDQRLKSIDELESIYGTLHITKDTPIIVYCHSGVRSAHTTFVLTQLLGYTNVKNYDGSWTEWSFFDDLPIEKDSL
jgi:thiosulfate/3-mercaptopyruvate sulfurtransferase